MRTSSARAAASRRSGAWPTSGRSTATSTELDGRGRCAVPGLVDCHTHACFGGDRVEEFALRAAGASYEELHAAGGGILSTVRATRAAGEDGPARGRSPAPRLDARGGDDDVRVEVGLRPRPRDRAGIAARDRRRGRHPDLARGSRRAAGVRRRGRLPRLRARRGAARSGVASPRRRTSSSSGGRSTRLRLGATSRPAARPAWRCACTATSSRRRGRYRSRSSSARARSTISRRPGDDGVRALARQRRRGRAPARRARSSSTGRCRLRARSSMPGAAVALATDFNPGQRLLREPAARLLARGDAAAPLAEPRRSRP